MNIKSMVSMSTISSCEIISLKKSHLVSLFITLLLLTGTSNASIILGANTVSTDGGELLGVSQIIDQSGLSTNYVSGVTDFNSYISSSPTHNSGSGSTIWASDNTTSGVIDFGFNEAVTLKTLALWSRDGSLFGIKDFSLFISDVADFSSAILIGDFTAALSAGGNSSATNVQLFSFQETSGSFLRLQYYNNYGDIITEVGEIAFESVSSVPVPAAVWLFGSGLLGLIGVGRCKKA